eukprot:1096432-Pleurochrysis_carterae.AAC.1
MAALVLQSSSMAGACRHFARTVLEGSRHHILNGGFHPRVWAQWASITHTSGNLLKVLRELTCNQRIGGESDNESDSGAPAEEEGATERKSATAVLVPNLREKDGAQLAPHGKTATTLSFTASIISSLRQAHEAGTLINITAADGVLGNSSEKFCIWGLVAGDGFKAGSSNGSTYWSRSTHHHWLQPITQRMLTAFVVRTRAERSRFNPKWISNKEKLAGLAECGKNAAVKTACKAFANAYYGFNFETPCPFKFKMVCPDPLNAYLNVVIAVSYHNALHPVSHLFALPCGTLRDSCACILRLTHKAIAFPMQSCLHALQVMQHGVHEKLQVDKGDDTALKAIKKEACNLVNFACIAYRVRLEFSTSPKDAMPEINSNTWKEIVKP